MKKRFLALAILIGGGLLAGCTTNTGDEAAVTYKGGTISEQELTDSLKKMQGADSTVQQLIVFQVFEEKYGDDVSDKKVDSEYNKTKEQLGDSFDSQLKAAGYTEKTFKENLKQRLAYQEGLEKHVKLTDEDLKTAWKSFHPEVEAQIIKVASEDEAKEVKKSADNGDDFAKLAKEKSTDTETKEDGGKIKFDSQSQTVPAEVQEAAFKLKDGQVSDVITATNASTYSTDYYVVKMVKNQNKGNDMDKYKDQLKEIATQTKLNDQAFTTKVIGEVLKDANVKIKDKDFENVLSTFTTTSSSSK
ncbi:MULTISPECIES: peptidylprolyl isomerase [unclassified Enterococcus]|uniref:peptidylprolyl isomerase n=1 Tax=unclassified Enterococcus TaxID=2608891 RepID=UPI0013EA12AD|nr:MULTISPECIES: peptidylprolyl isomerase [unclassified Enterococcus]